MQCIDCMFLGGEVSIQLGLAGGKKWKSGTLVFFQLKSLLFDELVGVTNSVSSFLLGIGTSRCIDLSFVCSAIGSVGLGLPPFFDVGQSFPSLLKHISL